MNIIHTAEHVHSINGVAGRMFNRVLDNTTGLFRNQRFCATRQITGYANGAKITVEIRFDDECQNGHQSFAITASVQEPLRRDISAGGCLHDDIAAVFPELAPLIKWHLMGTDAPMHYVANAAYHASNCDHSGFTKGQPCAWDDAIRFSTFPIQQRIGKRFLKWLKARIEFNKTTLKSNPARKAWAPVAVAHVKDTYDFDDKWTLDGYDCQWHECPFDTLAEAQEFCAALNGYDVEFVKIPTAYSKGKERDLNAARSCAIWPDATDEQLCAPRPELEATLRARLPALVAAFRADMESCGFLWEQPIAALVQS